MKYLFLFLFAIWFVSCAETTGNVGPISGTENGACFTNGTCNDGLICINDKCIKDNCAEIVCDEWLECFQETAECSKLKEGFCLDENDCNTELNEICDNEHKCNTPTSNCDPSCEDWQTCKDNKCETNTGKCANNNDCVNQICNSSHECVNEDLCLNTDCSADLNSECNPETGNCDCKTNFHLENNKSECLANSKSVDCLIPEVNHSRYTVLPVTINWSKTDNSWESIPQCDWECEDNYYKNNDTCEECSCDEWETCSVLGECSLDEGRCTDDSSCSNDKVCDVNHNCVNAQNPCEGVTCGDNGTCHNLEGIAVCVCDENYYDDGSLNCVNPCEGVTCSNHGICVSTTILNAYCECDENYFPSGLNCVSPCTGYWDCTTSTIVIDEELESKKLSPPPPTGTPRGVCTATDINTATCDCFEGYEDIDNDLICTSVCTGITCGGHGTCSVVDGKPACTCLTGYAIATEDPLICVDIDECISGLDNCSINARCMNTLGGFTCTCNLGYEGDGFTCTATDACNNSCDSWEYCSNGLCRVVAGRCNNDLDCARSGCLIRNDTNYTPINPEIDPDCVCNETTHYCYDTHIIAP
jgi:hypothetical protein